MGQLPQVKLFLKAQYAEREVWKALKKRDEQLSGLIDQALGLADPPVTLESYDIRFEDE